MAGKSRLSVQLVQQGVWDNQLESMPLAMGYLKSVALADERIAKEVEITIRNFGGDSSPYAMADELFGAEIPDVLAFSVLGWNYRTFGSLAETFKQLNPDGWVIFGGTHVAHQGARAFRMFPEVDVVVDGEGEFIFRDLLLARLDEVSRRALGGISGLTYQGSDGSVVSTGERERIADLAEIPSPFLTGAIDMTDDDGRFRYDVALLETNRGCPYKCAFCFWGGATGQKVRAFPRERLRAELELFAKLRVHTIVLCDANFGMLPGDADFVADLIEVREQYGFPRALEASWAKNKSKTFYSIVHEMKQAGIRSSFTLALQTLDDHALDLMRRRNMKVNQWEDLVSWLYEEGLDCYAELIWGSPGETVASFMAGYDRLARKVSRIACYPMLLLPNTDYAEKKQQHGIISIRGRKDDFEYVLANSSVSFAENRQMIRFLYWARVLAEMCVLRCTWIGLRELGEISQSSAIGDFAEWIEVTGDPAAAPLRAAAHTSVGGDSDLATAISMCYTDTDTKQLLVRWWEQRIYPRLKPEVAALVDAIFRFDLLTQPVVALPGVVLPETVVVRDIEYYLMRDVKLDYDLPAVIEALRSGKELNFAANPTTVDLYYRTGAQNAVYSTNHETIIHYMGMTGDKILGERMKEIA